MYGILPACGSVCVPCACGVHRKFERALDPLELSAFRALVFAEFFPKWPFGSEGLVQCDLEKSHTLALKAEKA